ncbi:autotransporter outer membrane beta-barrel domain-containing protein [Helicobacter sp. 'house sparrow 1']|uniref:autotransporter outer membrane beta-barrel domain-containing protein n=3 Tax=unclassified Helicobacter TaxID=2593540 RepID=UPI0013154C20|nr:autotransporter outer membrane beta-barrel domain-containing protein [Helicobacter sp. 'house sparrow 1']
MDVKNIHLEERVSTASNKTLKNSFFKPIVASSLALLLGSSLYASGSLDTNCGGDNTCAPIAGNITLEWGKVDNGSDFSVSGTENDKTITFNESSSKANTINFRDSAFTGGSIFTGEAEGGHLMTVIFNDRTNKIFNLEAQNDFKGNLKLIGGHNQSEFNGTFSKNFTGDIDIASYNGYTAAKTTLTFKGNSENVLTGNITVDSGVTTLNFENNGKIVGKLLAKTTKFNALAGGSINVNFKKNGVIDLANSSALTGESATNNYVIETEYHNNGGSNTITFSGENSINAINGGILARKSGHNTIIFSGKNSTNSITGEILASSYGRDIGHNTVNFLSTAKSNSISGTIKAAGGQNHITFGKTQDQVTVGGVAATNEVYNVIAERDAYFNSGKNFITFENNTTNTVTNTIKGTVTATYGFNTIIFRGIGKNSIEKDVIAQTSAYGGRGENNITFEGGIENVIKGKIRTDNGSNNIIFKNSASNSIGVVSAGVGTNSIIFNDAGTNSVGLIEVGGDSTAENQITFNGGTNTINGNIQATGGYKSDSGPKSKNVNTITFNGGTNIINGQVLAVRYLGKYGNTLNIQNASLTINSKSEGTTIGNNDDKVTLTGSIVANAKGFSVINFEGERSSLNLQQQSQSGAGAQARTQTVGEIINNSDESTTTLNFNAKQADVYGNIINKKGATYLNFNASNATLDGEVQAQAGTLNLSFSNDASFKATKITTESGVTTNLDIYNNQATLSGDLDFKGTLKLSFFDNSALNLTGGTATKTISNLTTVGDGVINLSGQTRWQEDLVSKDSFQTLEISSLSANRPLSFIVHVNPNATGDQTTKSDRIIIEGNSANSSKTHYLGVMGNPDELIGKDLYTQGGDNNIALATVSNSSGITLEATDSINGFSLVTYDFTKETTNKDTQSGSGYTTYFLGSAKSNGASLANQLASASALSANYDLYLANLNSLNKRMGELRNNANSQGVWIRVFNGMQTSKFALETKSIYTTIQAGYDYAFGFNGANNYVGFALSYANSMSDTKSIDDRANNGLSMTRGIKRINSNAMEFAIYNAYVQDGASKESGWKNGLYSDSILKFSYITSKLDLLGQIDTYSTNNFAVTFSQELGYRFLFGSSKEIFIDPQVEVALGYLNQSDLKQKLGQATLEGIQDSIFTLRTRVGSSFGYDFKNFTQDKGFNSKIYLGTYFVNDYISGGDVSLTDKYNAKVSLSPLSTTSRFVLNVGTNFSIKDNHRIYFDFERSFGGKIITDYQVNLGYRYSFGASKYTPYNGVSTTEIKQVESIKEMAPTKGFYLQVFEKDKLSKKEENTLKKIKDLRVQNKGNSKVYLVGPFNSEQDASKQKDQMQGILKELNSNANVIVVE